jgi:hypothetical protein
MECKQFFLLWWNSLFEPKAAIFLQFSFSFRNQAIKLKISQKRNHLVFDDSKIIYKKNLSAKNNF